MINSDGHGGKHRTHWQAPQMREVLEFKRVTMHGNAFKKCFASVEWNQQAWRQQQDQIRDKDMDVVENEREHGPNNI